MAELMLASQTERTLVAAAEVPWSLGSVSKDFLVLGREPSTLTEYLSKPWSSSTTPVLSHLLANLPAAFWFWINTSWPEISLGNTLLRVYN